MPNARNPARKSSAHKRARRKKRVLRRSPRAPSPRAIEAVLAELAHDIRTPLAGILALGELLAASALGERERNWASTIRSTAEHLSLLTSLIVDAVRAADKGLVLRREPISLRVFADALAASLVARAETKGLQAQVIIGDLPQRVIGDGLR